MVLLNGVLSEFVDREQERVEILFVAATFLPTLSRVAPENMVARRLDQSQCRPLSIAQLVELGSRERMHARLVESLHFVLLDYSYKHFIDKLSLR